MSFRRRRIRRFTRTRRRGRNRTFGRSLVSKTGFTRRTGFFGRFNSRYASNVPAFTRREELKFKDTGSPFSSVPSNGIIFPLSINEVKQGTGESERIGRNILIKKVMFKGTIHLNSNTQPSNATPQAAHDVLRVLVFIDKQSNGSSPGVEDILEGTVANPLNHSVNSFRNLANSKRFRILYDKRIVMNANFATVNSADQIISQRKITQFNWYLNVNIPIEFDGVDGITSEIKSNNIGVLLITADSRITFDGIYRIRYTG